MFPKCPLPAKRRSGQARRLLVGKNEMRSNRGDTGKESGSESHEAFGEPGVLGPAAKGSWTGA